MLPAPSPTFPRRLFRGGTGGSAASAQLLEALRGLLAGLDTAEGSPDKTRTKLNPSGQPKAPARKVQWADESGVDDMWTKVTPKRQPKGAVRKAQRADELGLLAELKALILAYETNGGSLIAQLSTLVARHSEAPPKKPPPQAPPQAPFPKQEPNPKAGPPKRVPVAKTQFMLPKLDASWWPKGQLPGKALLDSLERGQMPDGNVACGPVPLLRRMAWRRMCPGGGGCPRSKG